MLTNEYNKGNIKSIIIWKKKHRKSPILEKKLAGNNEIDINISETKWQKEKKGEEKGKGEKEKKKKWKEEPMNDAILTWYIFHKLQSVFAF
jgi:hypothetical protein